MCSNLSLSFLLVCITVVSGKGPLDIRKGVIVHLFEWKYDDIASECEQFLGPKGFAGVQISPPSENIVSPGRPWWERYQPVSYQLTTRSGNRDKLADMLWRCNCVGVRVFADVVFNHMTGNSADCQGTGSSSCSSSALSYPAVPYDWRHFHRPACAINNYNNASEVRNCELVGLHDLNQTKPYVRDKIVEYLNELIQLGVAGFRVDAAKHMNPVDLGAIYDRLRELNITHGFPSDTKPFIYQEVIDFGGEAVKYQEYTGLGFVTDMRIGRELSRCFQGNNDLKWLKNFGSAWNLLPDDRGVVFIENHDTERGSDVLTYKSSRPYKMAVCFMLAYGYGTPKVLSSYQFSSFEQGPPHDSQDGTLSPSPGQDDLCRNGWLCQHRWRQIYNMVGFHNIVRGAQVTSWWDNGKNQIAFCRGDKGFVAFNLENYPLNKTLQTCLPAGTYCDVISGSLVNGRCTGKTLDVADDGMAYVTVARFDQNDPSDGVVAVHVGAKQSGSDCRYTVVVD